MTTNPADAVLRHLRTLAARRDDPATDSQLLRSFAATRDEAAFAALLRRHGAMVLGVCRRLLRNEADAEDAFQATFLVLARKAGSVRCGPSLAPWLHGVARRVALNVRAEATRRPAEALAEIAGPAADTADELTWREVRGALDEELSRLPERLRAPLVLCYLEGLARDEAAARLGCPLGTLKGRLERGRDLLRRRLTRRGLGLAAALAALALERVAVPAALAAATARAAVGAPAGAAVMRLAGAALRDLVATKVRTVAALLLGLTVLVTGTGLLTRPAPAGNARPAGSEPGQADPAPGASKAKAGPRADPLPPGALARLGTERFRHTHTVRSVAYSPDGQRLVSASWDGSARLWDAADGHELRRFPLPGGGSGGAVSPDGRLIVTGDMERNLIFWDAATGKELRRVAKLDDTIFFIAFSPDGKLVAAGSGDALRLWESATGQELHRLDPSKGGVRPILFSPDGTALAAGCADGTVRLWDVATGKESRRLVGHEGRVWSFAFAADGKTITTAGGAKDRTIRVWDAAAGREMKRWSRATAGSEEKLAAPNAVALDGWTLAAGGDDGRVRVWDVATGKERGTLPVPGQDDKRGPWVMGLALSPDGKTLAVATTSPAITLWDTATLAERPAYPGHRGAVNAVAFVAGHGLASGGGDGALCFWDAAGGKESGRQEAHGEEVRALAVSPDGRTLVSAGGDGRVRVWDAVTHKELRQWAAHRGWVVDVALSPDGKTLATGAWADHAIRLWTLDGKEKLTIKLENGGNYGNLPLCFSPDGKVLASGSADRTKNTLYLWDAVTGRELRRIPEMVGDRRSLAFDGAGRLAVAGGKTVRLYDPATGQRVGGFDGDGDAGTCIAYSPDGRLLAAGGGPDRPTVRVWEVASGKLVGKRSGHKGWLRCIAFSPNGRTVATGSEDTTVIVWDVAAFAGDGRPPDDPDVLWADLAADDAARARRAVEALAANPRRSVPLLARQLRRVEAADGGRAARLVRDLDADDFETRERASRELAQLGEGAGPTLREALAGKTSAEVRRRVEGLLENLRAGPGPELLRALRAVEVLEHVSTPAARRALAELAKGLPEARLTREAKAALERSAKRQTDSEKE
jgi:RNA polymerase sigma factor (sigma-70 family)